MTKGIAIFYFILFESLATQLLHHPYHFDECSVSLFHSIHRDSAPAVIGMSQFSRGACRARYRCLRTGSRCLRVVACACGAEVHGARAPTV